MVIYLGVNSQIRILCLDGEQKPERAAREESRLKLYISIYSIGGHAPSGQETTGHKTSYSRAEYRSAGT